MEWQAFLQGLHKKIRELSLVNDDELNEKRNESDIVSLLQRNENIRELISMWFDSRDKLKKLKCNIKAKCLKDGGNEAFKNKNYGKSIELYTESAKNADMKSNDLAIAFANRSASYFHLNKYNQCLKDISLALELNYPKELRYKIYLRRAQCYFKLQEYEKAEKEVNQTKESVVNNNKISKSNKENILTEIYKLSTFIKNAEMKKVEETDENNEKEIKLFDDLLRNPEFPSASSALERKHSPTRGRYVVAKSPIKKGDVLFVEKPFAFVPLDHVNSDIVCSHCCKVIEDYLIPCRGCLGVSYCSQKCWNESWTLYHKWECPGYEIDLWKQIGIAHLAIKVFLISSTTTDINKFNAVQNLVTNIDKLSEDDLIVYSITATMLAFYLERYTDFFKTVNLNDSVISKFEDKTNLNISTDKLKFVSSLILRNMLQLIANGHAITKLNLTREDINDIFVEEQERIAVGIYPSVSMLNHSCDPTIINTFWNDYLIVKAIKNVAIGGEVFNCYGPHFRRMPLRERQKALKSQYCFECKCESCTNPNLQFFLDRFNAFKCKKCDEPVKKVVKTSYKCLKCDSIVEINEINNIKLTKKLFNSADNFLQSGNNNEASNYLIQCLNIQQKIFYKYHDDITNTLDFLGKLNIIMDKKIHSIKYLEQCLDAIQEKFGSDSIEVVNELNKITDICFQYLQQQSKHTTSTYKDVMKKTRGFIQRANEIIEIISGPWDDLYKEFNEKNKKISEMLENFHSN